MKILVVLPEKAPFVKDIEIGIESLQNEIGGNVEAVYIFKDNACIICNEEGKLLGLPFNRALKDEAGGIFDIVAGKFLIVGLGDKDFVDLSLEQQSKYAQMFETPEIFLCCNGTWRVCPASEFPDQYEKVIKHYYSEEDIEI